MEKNTSRKKNPIIRIVTTLALGSWLRHGLQGCGPRGKPMNHISCSRECKKVWGNEPSHFQVNFHLGSWNPKWTSKSSESNCKGQNSMDRSVSYIIEKLLELMCLKWVCMTHLNIWNTSYGQKKCQESNCQFDSLTLKIKNWPDFLVCKWCTPYHWKALDKG